MKSEKNSRIIPEGSDAGVFVWAQRDGSWTFSQKYLNRSAICLRYELYFIFLYSKNRDLENENN